jgi:hypothetical protein
MKRLVLLACVFLTVMILLFTDSMYVEVSEFVAIVFFSSGLSVALGIYLYRILSERSLVFCATISFLLFMGICLFDLFADHAIHYSYWQMTADGRALTLGEKIEEFFDDLLAVSFISPMTVIAALSLWHLFKRPYDPMQAPKK